MCCCTNKQVYRANRTGKTRHQSKEEALDAVHQLRIDYLEAAKGWFEKAAPPLSKVHDKRGKSKMTLRRFSVARSLLSPS
jgi:hypothetical protein